MREFIKALAVFAGAVALQTLIGDPTRADGIALAFIGALAGGAILGAGGGALKTLADTKAVDDMAEQDAKTRAWIEADRRYFENLYRQSRGSEGSAILPLYFGTGDSSMETQGANDIRQLYNATNRAFGTGADRLARFSGATDALRPAMAGAIDAATAATTGAMTGQALAEARPVMEARTRAAAAKREGFAQALAQRLAALGAQDRAKGYTGTGSFAQKQLLGTSFAANQAAAEAEAGAALENAILEAAIREEGRRRALASAALPLQLAQASTTMEGMPIAAAGRSVTDQFSPLNWYRIGNEVPYAALPRMPAAPFLPSDRSLWLNYAGDQVQSLGSLAGSGSGFAGLGGLFGGGA